MSIIRVAVASTPLTTTLDQAIPATVAAIEEAGRLGASIVCLPESGLPGHRVQARPVPDVSVDEIEDAFATIAAAARAAHIVAIVGAERPTVRGREIVAVVFDSNGTYLGEQAKTQIDPSEEADYVPGSGRRVFTAGGATFGIAICHEAFRYPEISRSLVLAGAQIVFVPHFVTTEDGSLPMIWCDAANPYNEKALLMRALENSVFVAASNITGPAQGSITGVIAPDGRLVASVDYGRVGVVAADIELDEADGALAKRWAPERQSTADPMEKVFEIYIKATPERLWHAITDPATRARYSFGVVTTPDGDASSGYHSTARGGDLEIAEGENLEVDPPRRLVQSFRALWSDDVRAEGTSRVTWEIEPVGDSCHLTVTHDQLPAGANEQLYGGWPMILSGLKTWLETGELLTTPGSLLYATPA